MAQPEEPLLCKDCSEAPQARDGSLRICTRAQVLKKTDFACRTFLNRVLRLVSAIRNTPGENFWEERWKILQIHLTEQDPSEQYLQLFLDKIVDKLNSMIQGSCFCENFLAKEDEGYIYLHVRACTEFISTVDYKSPESCDRGLLSLNFERFRDILFSSSRSKSSPNEDAEQATQCSPFEGKELTNGEPVNVKESTHLQLKSLQPDQKKNQKKKRGFEQEVFSPKSGKDYARWLWENFTKTLGEYISAFAKCPEGGVYYCGIKEDKEKPTDDSQVRKVTKIRALSLPDDWKKELQDELKKRIRNDMLWVESNDDKGYNILPPEEIREGPLENSEERNQVEIKFLDVKDPTKPGESFYILEVKTAPFQGIVFCSKEGPETYVFGEDGRTPVRMGAEEWLSKATEYGWCRSHRQKKEVRCGIGSHCSKCGHFEDYGGSCVKVTKMAECARCPQ